MGSTKKYNGSEWKKFGSTKAVDIKITDYSGNFESDNVEGALREASSKLSDTQSSVEAQKKAIQEHSQAIANQNALLAQHNEDIEWLKVNGGGGGGGNIIPTITSKFEDGTIVEKDKDVIIPIFYSSPNLGDGLAYIIINGIEVDSVSVKQGNNSINIGTLTDLNTEVSIYVKDRAGMLSNQLTWNIICGGIDFIVDFDSTADYGVTDEIVMQYNITSASTEPIIMHMTIDYDAIEFECSQGHNEYKFENLSVGIHSVSMYVTSGPYVSQTEVFNIVVVNAESLYISTTFKGGEFEYGVPIPIDYRISKMGTETFEVKLYLDDSLDKALSATAGSYYWTLNGVAVGEHEFLIMVDSAYGEHVELTGTFTVYEGEYTPIDINKAGLIYRLDAYGRTNNDSDRSNPKDASGNGVKATLHNFNYFSNGWIDNALVCDGNSYVEIDLYPWSDNAIYGSTIEIQYKGLDIGVFGARIFDYTDVETPYKGVYIDLEETTMKSLANTGKINLDADVWITISFVIDRKNKFGKIYIDGICSRAFSLSDTGSGTAAIREDFTHLQKIFLNSRKGEDKFGACEIKDLRVYSRVLSDVEIEQNFIAQEKDLTKQKELYDFFFNNRTLPAIRMYGDTTNMTLETPVTMRIKYTSPNEEKYGQSFDLPYCQVNWQGTSSLQYVLKNFTARLKDEFMADYNYTPYPNGIEENVYCFKADYMESTHSRNAGLAKFVNECLYDEKNPAQLKDSRVRNAVNGFPALMYINDELQGVYNFNLDRYSTKSFGYTEDTTLVYEVSANSDTTAGAFYKWDESSGKSKLDYYKSDFECLYPPTRAAGNDNMEELIRLVEWVHDSSDEDFKDNIGRYFNLQYLLRYFLYVYVVGAVDSLGKNMKLATWDGLIWYPQVYDADTTIGLDNTGFLKFDMDIEMGDEGVFNTTGSQLWKKVQLLFKAELEEQYAIMRQKYFTVENMMKYILEEQIGQIPAHYYNIDMQTKYLNFGSSYLYALHGSSEHHIRKWLRERLIYCDTLFGYTVSTADYITLRSSKLGYVYLDIQTYIPMYVRVKWRDEANNTGVQVKRVARGETVRFDYTMPTATDQEIIVYAGYYLKSLGDVSNLQPTSMLIANASRLTEIECHSDNLINTDLSECTKLQRIDLSNSSILGTGIGAQPILNIQNCKYLRYCNCYGTQLTAIYTMQQGGNLEELYFPETTQVIQVTNQTYLRVLGIPENCTNLAQVQITNCNAIEYAHYPFVEGDPIKFDSFKYVQNLTLTNSLEGLTKMSFNGFSKLRNVTLNSLSKLEQLGFDDMLLVGETTTIKNITISDCPLIDIVTFNASSEDYKVEFAENATIDISGLQSCETIECNYSIKGLNKIILPNTIKNVYLSAEYGDGNNELMNLWSSSAYVTHLNDDFQGIDFIGMNLENFSMDGCSNLKIAINFFLTPINELPNLAAFESIQGWVNFDQYIGDVRYMFKDINFTYENFSVIFNQIKSQTDITGLFQNATITKAQFDSIIAKFPNATVYDYFLEGSTIEEDYEFPNTAVSVIGAFKDCKLLKTYHENWLTEYKYGIVSTDCYRGCTGVDLDYIPAEWGGYGFDDISYVTIYEITIPSDNYILTLNGDSANMWDEDKGCISWGDGGKEYNTAIGSVSHTYAEAGVYTIKARFTLNSLGLECIKNSIASVLTRVIQEPSLRTSFSNAYTNCSSLIEFCPTEINANACNNMFSGCVNLSSVTLTKIGSPTSMSNMFGGCSSLEEVIGMENWDMSKVTTIANLFANTNIKDLSSISNWQLTKCTDVSYAFNGIKNTIPSLDCSNWNLQSATSLAGLFLNFKVNELNVTNLVHSGINNLDSMMRGCNASSIIGTATWDVSNVTHWAYIFSDVRCSEIDISSWKILKTPNSNSLTNTFASSNIETIIANNIITTGSIFNSILKNTKATKITMDEISSEMTDFNSMFENFSTLKYDIKLPSYTVTASKTFKNCTSMTHVHANWETEYELGVFGIPGNWWITGYLVDAKTGQLTANSGQSVTPFIEFTSAITLSSSYTGGAYIRCVGYDADQNAIATYNYAYDYWVGLGAYDVYAGALTSKTIVYREDIKYIRFSANTSVCKLTSINLGIPRADCYAGCTAITNIDGKEVICGLDQIPEDWGGYDFVDGMTAEIIIDTTGYAGVELDIWQRADARLIDWGDGTVERYDGVNALPTTHTYVNEGIYRLKAKRFTNTQGLLRCGSTLTPKEGLRNTLIEVVRVDMCQNTEHRRTFYNCTKLKKANVDYTQGWTKLNGVLYNQYFFGCSALEEVTFKTDAVLQSASLQALFSGCTSLTKINMPDPFINSTVGCSMYDLFRQCKSMTDFSFIRDWTLSVVTITEAAFYGCTSMTSLDLSNTNMPITRFRGMFYGCTNLVEVNTDGWLTENPGGVITVYYSQDIQRNCTKLINDVNMYIASKRTIQAYDNIGCDALPDVIDFASIDSSQITNIYPHTGTREILNLHSKVGVQFSTRDMSRLVRVKNVHLKLVNLSYFYYYGGGDTWDWTFETYPDSVQYKCETWGDLSPNGLLQLWNTKWTVDSLVSFFECLYDYAAEGTTATKTLNLQNNLEKLTDEQIAIATDKGWTVAY